MSRQLEDPPRRPKGRDSPRRDYPNRDNAARSIHGDQGQVLRHPDRVHHSAEYQQPAPHRPRNEPTAPQPPADGDPYEPALPAIGRQPNRESGCLSRCCCYALSPHGQSKASQAPGTPQEGKPRPPSQRRARLGLGSSTFLIWMSVRRVLIHSRYRPMRPV